ncbi:hypothetical protein D1872_36680 [compost metagenome]
MSYHLIYTPEGRFVGYTTNKSEITLFKQQRTDREFNIVKVDNHDIPKAIRKTMEEAVLNIEEMHGVYLLQEEYEKVLEEMTRRINNLYSACDGLSYINQFLKLDAEEEVILTKFAKMGSVVVDIVDLVISTGEHEVYRDFIDMPGMMMDILHGWGL